MGPRKGAIVHTIPTQCTSSCSPGLRSLRFERRRSEQRQRKLLDVRQRRIGGDRWTSVRTVPHLQQSRSSAGRNPALRSGVDLQFRHQVDAGHRRPPRHMNGQTGVAKLRPRRDSRELQRCRYPTWRLYSVLRQVAGENWEFTDKDGTVYTFNSAGKLLKIHDANLRRLVFNYDGAGLLETVVSDPDPAPGVAADARKLTFGWTGGHITSVKTEATGATDQAPWSTRVWNGPTSTPETCSPRCAILGAPSPWRRRPTVPSTSTRRTAPENHSPTPPWSENERPIGNWRLDETTGATRLMPAEAVTLAPTTRVTLSPLPHALRGQREQGGHIWADEQLAKPAEQLDQGLDKPVSRNVVQNETADGVLFAMDNYTTSITEYVPVLRVDNIGKLRGGFWTTTGGSQIESPSSVTDGRWHHVVLSSTGYSQALWLDGVLVGEKTGSMSLTCQCPETMSVPGSQTCGPRPQAAGGPLSARSTRSRSTGPAASQSDRRPPHRRPGPARHGPRPQGRARWHRAADHRPRLRDSHWPRRLPPRRRGQGGVELRVQLGSV